MKNAMKTGILMFIVAGAGVATAQEAGHLNVMTTVHKEEVTIDDAGNRSTRLVDASKVVPGDEVIYTVTFANVSDVPAENVVITNPLPAELTYVDGSAFGPGSDIEFSVDGGKTFGKQEQLIVNSDDGERPALTRDFTHIRWVMAHEIAPGSQGVSRFRARLN